MFTFAIYALRRRRGRQKGAEALEFTLALLPLMIILFVLLDIAWSVFCKSAPDERSNANGSAPASTVDHDCCLGLAHAPALLAPSSAFVLLPASTPALPPSLPVEQTGAAGIRDGPQQPRGPPTLLV